MSDRLFVHFLNRELYRSIGTKYIYGVNQVIKCIMLSFAEKMAIPLSSLWEGHRCNDLDYNFLKVLFENALVDTISDCVSVDEFLERNKSLYYFDKKRYDDIYFRKQKQLMTISPTIIMNRGATYGISEMINLWGRNGEIGVDLPEKDRIYLEQEQNRIISVSQTREDRAITASLFFKKPECGIEMAVSRLLSAYYINYYCNENNADIVTNSFNQLKFYDRLSREYPKYDLSIAKIILKLAGFDFIHKKCFSPWYWYKMAELRAVGEMATIHCNLRNIFSSITKNTNNGALYSREDNNCAIAAKILKQITKKSIIRKCGGINAKHDIAILEDNTQIILNRLLTQPDLDDRRTRSMENDYKIFVSHSQSDKQYAEAVVNLILGVGVPEAQIICTSIPGMGIPLDEDIYDYLRNEFVNSKLYVIFLLSENYYNSTASQNEMGATWVLQKTYTTFLLPNFSFSSVKGAVNPSRISISLDADKMIISDLLNQFRDNLQRLFTLNNISETRWERLKNEFYSEIEKASGKKII